MYQQGNEQSWAKPAKARRDWLLAREALVPLLQDGSEILDVGCWTGEFLASLPDLYRRYGIEIHHAASKQAELKGIDIVGDDWVRVAGNFDCVTSFDVIEHVEKPGTFLKHCLAAVRPGGWVLVSTGNLDSFTFSLMGSRYWYCAIPEHISFISPAWFDLLEGPLGFRVLTQTRFAHDHCSVLNGLRQSVSNLLYRFSPKVLVHLRKIGLGRIDLDAYPSMADYPPVWSSAQDHFLVLIQKR